MQTRGKKYLNGGVDNDISANLDDQSNEISITKTELDSFNTDEGMSTNIKKMQKLGGVAGIMNKLTVSKAVGLDSHDINGIENRIGLFGSNKVRFYFYIYLRNITGSEVSYSMNLIVFFKLLFSVP